MGSYKILITKAAEKDKEHLKFVPALKRNVDKLLSVLRENPYKTPPPYEKLCGDLKGLYSRRINRQHRLVYSVSDENKTVVIVSMWTHYEFK